MTKLINQRTGSLYTRAIAIVIQNPLDGSPAIRFNEEDVVVEADGNQKSTGFSGDYVQAEMTDPTESFRLINPLTGEPIDESSTGNVTEMQVLMTSFYYYLKEKQQVDVLRNIIQEGVARAGYYPTRITSIEQMIANTEEEKLNNPENTEAIDAQLEQLNLDLTSTQNEQTEWEAKTAQAEADLSALLLTLDNDFS
jgi:hypothetical protein